MLFITAVLSDGFEHSEDFKIHFCHHSFHLHVNMVFKYCPPHPFCPDPDFHISNHCIFFASFADLNETKPRPKCSFSCLQLSIFCLLPAGKIPKTVLDPVFSISDSLLLQEKTNKSADLKQFKLELFNYWILTEPFGFGLSHSKSVLWNTLGI